MFASYLALFCSSPFKRYVTCTTWYSSFYVYTSHAGGKCPVSLDKAHSLIEGGRDAVLGIAGTSNSTRETSALSLTPPSRKRKKTPPKKKQPSALAVNCPPSIAPCHTHTTAAYNFGSGRGLMLARLLTTSQSMCFHHLLTYSLLDSRSFSP